MEFVLQSYVKEIKGTPMRANIIDPGRIRTTMRADAYPGEDPKTLPEPACITGTFVRLALASCTANGERFMAEIEGWEPQAGDEDRWQKLDNGSYIPG